jgi:hypothetical protein
LCGRICAFLILVGTTVITYFLCDPFVDLARHTTAVWAWRAIVLSNDRRREAQRQKREERVTRDEAHRFLLGKRRTRS